MLSLLSLTGQGFINVRPFRERVRERIRDTLLC